ncbi:MAG: hypothetical protein J3K34DRAFT_126713 [Monoraphidium minutum]|nr:MAG: hypothetical protein J3K34DRAFT_126713 [Monoraphidium minutum]
MGAASRAGGGGGGACPRARGVVGRGGEGCESWPQACVSAPRAGRAARNRGHPEQFGICNPLGSLLALVTAGRAAAYVLFGWFPVPKTLVKREEGAGAPGPGERARAGGAGGRSARAGARLAGREGRQGRQAGARQPGSASGLPAAAAFSRREVQK